MLIPFLSGKRGVPPSKQATKNGTVLSILRLLHPEFVVGIPNTAEYFGFMGSGAHRGSEGSSAAHGGRQGR